MASFTLKSENNATRNLKNKQTDKIKTNLKTSQRKDKISKFLWYLRYARDFWWSPNEKKEAHDDQNGFWGGSNRHITAAAKSSWFPISLGQGLDSFCLMKIQSHTILDMEAIYFHFQHLEQNKKMKTGKSNLKSTNRTKRVFSCQWISENEIPNWFRLGFLWRKWICIAFLNSM